jgi:hypothetical protein
LHAKQWIVSRQEYSTLACCILLKPLGFNISATGNSRFPTPPASEIKISDAKTPEIGSFFVFMIK